MGIYTKEIGGLGYAIYRLNRRMIKTASVPGNIMELLETQDEVDDTNTKLTAPLKKCVFCKAPTKLFRILNGQTIYVCQEHYHTKTVGQTIQQVRLNIEASDAKVNQT